MGASRQEGWLRTVVILALSGSSAMNGHYLPGVEEIEQIIPLPHVRLDKGEVRMVLRRRVDVAAHNDSVKTEEQLGRCETDAARAP